MHIRESKIGGLPVGTSAVAEEGSIPVSTLEHPAAVALASRHVLELPRWPVRVLLAGGALYLFVLGLQLLKSGARVVPLWMTAISAAGPLNALGAGWLLAYLALSGSPIAATALGLLGGGGLSSSETLAMIYGSRFGAAFIVLLLGALYLLRNHSQKAGIYVGVLALMVTASVYVPALLLGFGIHKLGWLDGVGIGGGATLVNGVDRFVGPVVQGVKVLLPSWAVLALGLGVLLGSFPVFDRALPQVNGHHPLAERVVKVMQRPLAFFVLGLVVSLLTLSVSVALGLLVPLVVRGIVNWRQVVPYIMGANIGTLADTLLASLMVGTPEAFPVVLTVVVSVALVSVAILALGFRRYNTLVLAVADRVASGGRPLVIFAGVMTLVPLALVLI